MSVIEFLNVGRDRKNWTANVNDPSESKIIEAIRAGRALMSRDISITYEPDDNLGTIYAGVRPVGNFTIKENQ